MRQCPKCKQLFDDRVAACADDGARLGPADPLLGTVIDDKYRVEQFVGAGGMGTVYLASQLNLERLVALKVIRASRADEVRIIERFRREALLLARLNHPSIVGIHDFGRVPGVGSYIAMEFLKGTSLRHEISRRGRMPPDAALPVMALTCRAVHAAHAAGIIHRDLKPDNIFFELGDDEWTVKVLDFGIAELASTAQAKDRMLAPPAAGTPHYMSPEQCLDSTADASSDVYSLGCVLYELLTGRPPFVGGSVRR